MFRSLVGELSLSKHNVCFTAAEQTSLSRAPGLQNSRKYKSREKIHQLGKWRKYVFYSVDCVSISQYLAEIIYLMNFTMLSALWGIR